LLSVKTLELLRKYFIEFKPKVWLFEGAKGETYSKKSIQMILKKASEKVGIKKHITVHTLRHRAVYPAHAGLLIYLKLEPTFVIFRVY